MIYQFTIRANDLYTCTIETRPDVIIYMFNRGNRIGSSMIKEGEIGNIRPVRKNMAIHSSNIDLAIFHLTKKTYPMSLIPQANFMNYLLIYIEMVQEPINNDEISCICILQKVSNHQVAYKFVFLPEGKS